MKKPWPFWKRFVLTQPAIALVALLAGFFAPHPVNWPVSLAIALVVAAALNVAIALVQKRSERRLR